MSLDPNAQLSRRSVAQQRIANELAQAQSLIDYARRTNPHNPRFMVIAEAFGDLAAAEQRGQDTGNEMALIGAIALGALVEQQEFDARCSCPLQPGVPAEARIVWPGCPAHGDAA